MTNSEMGKEKKIIRDSYIQDCIDESEEITIDEPDYDSDDYILLPDLDEDL